MTCASTAGAQPKPNKPPTDVQTDRARQLHNEADALFTKGDYERARVAYLAAWALKKHFQIAASLGDCELRLGRFRDAAEHLTFALRELPATSEWQSVRDGGGKMLADAKTHVGAVTLTVSAADADVSVDQTVIGKTPLLDPIFLEPGTHTIEVKKIGFVSKRVDVEAKAGKTEPLDVALEAEGGTTGAGGAPPDSTSAGAGGSGGGTATPPPSGKSVPLLVTGTVLAVVGVGVGATLIGLGASAATDRDGIRTQLPGMSSCGAGTPYASECGQVLEKNDAFIALSAGGGVALGVGAALGIATLLYGVVPSSSSSSEKKSTTLVLAPVLSPSLRGVFAAGTF